MPSKIILEIGMTGVFRLQPPFDSLMPAQAIYTVAAVRQLSDISAEGIDPFTTYYLPRNLSQTTYDVDFNNNVSIISLKSSVGQWLYVPETYILEYPSVNGVIYTALILGVSLGALPDTASLEPLKTAIKNIVKDMAGVDSVIKEVTVSTPALVSHSDHIAIEKARQASISIRLTDRARLSQATSDLAEARLKIKELENWIATHLP
jgi:hypothetical protein